MSKELREMLQELESKKAKVRALLGEDKVTDAENLMTEVRSLQKKVEMQQELEASEANNSVSLTAFNATNDKDLEKEYTRIFLKGIKRQRISNRSSFQQR